jgi:hypothetical protein
MSPARSSMSMAAPRPRRPDAPWESDLTADDACREAAHQTGAAGGKRRGVAGDRVRLGWVWREPELPDRAPPC